MNDEIDLLPCPFCGALPEIYNRISFEDSYDIRCNKPGCYLEFGADWYLSKEEVIEKWNKRANNDG